MSMSGFDPIEYFPAGIYRADVKVFKYGSLILDVKLSFEKKANLKLW